MICWFDWLFVINFVFDADIAIQKWICIKFASFWDALPVYCNHSSLKKHL